MRVLFIHQSLPAQYRHVIAALLRRGDQVLAIGEQSAAQRWSLRHPNMGVLAYRVPDAVAQAPVPPHLRMINLQLLRAEAVLQALRQLHDDTRSLRQAARRTVCERYDLHGQCVRAALEMLDRLARAARAVAA